MHTFVNSLKLLIKYNLRYETKLRRQSWQNGQSMSGLGFRDLYNVDISCTKVRRNICPKTLLVHRYFWDVLIEQTSLGHAAVFFSGFILPRFVLSFIPSYYLEFPSAAQHKCDCFPLERCLQQLPATCWGLLLAPVSFNGLFACC